MKKNILILCTGNSCRSQMAEGYIKYFAGGKANVFSAGIEKHGVNANAIKIMREDGIDISTHTSNSVTEYEAVVFDILLTVCDHAQEHCPYFPTEALKIHQSFADPAKAVGTTEEIEQQFRQVREEIKKYSQKMVLDYLSV